ncbi:16598_t:CDS:1, partial [Gigaspora rosea]
MISLKRSQGKGVCTIKYLPLSIVFLDRTDWDKHCSSAKVGVQVQKWEFKCKSGSSSAKMGVQV